jgi:iron(III) transport system substrate-binding protein
MLAMLKKTLPLACLGLAALAISVAAQSVIVGPALAQDAWKTEWDKTVAAANKEGRLVLYMRRYDAVLKDFAKAYPAIKPIIVSGEGAVIGARIMAERRADKYLVDFYVGGPYTAAAMLQPAGALDTIPDKLLLPEVTDTSKWVNNTLRYTDTEGKYNFAFLASPGTNQLAYNTSQVKAGEVHAYKDFLNPKWKGRIVSLDPTQRFIAGSVQFMYYHPDLGPDYIKALYETMDVTIARNTRQMTDWLATGKFALCIGCLAVEKAKQQGLPLEVLDTALFDEGGAFLAGSGSISLIDKAPNPNAAKVFLNWLLSRDGQIAVQRITDSGIHFNSGRIDIPKDDVDPQNRLIPGKKYYDQNSPEWADLEPMDRLTKEIMTNKVAQGSPEDAKN